MNNEPKKFELPQDDNKGGGENNTEGVEKIKIEWGTEAPEPMGWFDAREWCESLGEGWRLPTSEELKSALENKVPGFKSGSHYWTSYSYANSRSWFGYGDNDKVEGNYDDRDNKNAVRPVRDIS